MTCVTAPNTGIVGSSFGNPFRMSVSRCFFFYFYGRRTSGAWAGEAAD